MSPTRLRQQTILSALCTSALLTPLSSIADPEALLYMTPTAHKFEIRASGYCSGKISGSYQPAPGNFIHLSINSANQQQSKLIADTLYVTSQNAVVNNILTLNESVTVSAQNEKFSAKAKNSALFNMTADVPTATVNSAFRCKDGETFSAILAAGKAIQSTGSINITGTGGNYTYNTTGKQKRIF